MQELIGFLHSVHPLSTELTGHLSTIIKYRDIKRGDYLLRAGHVCRHICFIKEGLLRCFYSKGDVGVSSWFMKEGDVIVSIESFFQQRPSYESIQALEATKLYYIEFNELQFIYREFPEFNFIGRVLTERYYMLWAQQLFAIKMQPAPERYQWLLENHPDLLLRVPAKYIASYLGITEAHFSVVKGRG